MIVEYEAALWLGGGESDARLHIGVGPIGDVPKPSCAGSSPRQVAVVTYQAIEIHTQPEPVREAVKVLAEALTVQQLIDGMSEDAKARCCLKCAMPLVESWR